MRFRVETEMLIHGTTHPDAQVTLQGGPIKLRPDGSFSVRVDLPNRRQVIPLVACTKDGTSQRTIVLAVERNTKSWNRSTVNPATARRRQEIGLPLLLPDLPLERIMVT